METNIGLVKPQATDLGASEMAAVEKLQQGYHNLKTELGKVIVGQEAVIEELLIALFCKGHALLVVDFDAGQDAGPQLQPRSVHP